MDAQRTWLDPVEAADYLGISPHTLERYRRLRKRAGTDAGPQCSVVGGGKLIRYHRDWLDAWLLAHAVDAPRKKTR